MMDRDTITRTGARAPGVGRSNRSHGGVALRATNLDPERGVFRRQTTRRTDANQVTQSRRHTGRPRPISRPWSRTGENPPYGILGGTMETSASFEARSAPSSYPTSSQSAIVGDSPRAAASWFRQPASPGDRNRSRGSKVPIVGSIDPPGTFRSRDWLDWTVRVDSTLAREKR